MHIHFGWASEKWDGGRCWSKIQNFRKSIKHTWAERNKNVCERQRQHNDQYQEGLPSVCRPWTVPVVAGHGVFVWYCCKWRQRGLGLCWKPKLTTQEKSTQKAILVDSVLMVLGLCSDVNHHAHRWLSCSSLRNAWRVMRKEKMRTASLGENFFNAICLHDTKEKHKEIQQLHLVCDDLSPLLISDLAVSITQDAAAWQGDV